MFKACFIFDFFFFLELANLYNVHIRSQHAVVTVVAIHVNTRERCVLSASKTLNIKTIRVVTVEPHCR